MTKDELHVIKYLRYLAKCAYEDARLWPLVGYIPQSAWSKKQTEPVQEYIPYEEAAKIGGYDPEYVLRYRLKAQRQGAMYSKAVRLLLGIK